MPAVLCIATAYNSGVPMRAWQAGLIILAHQSPAILASSIYNDSISPLPDRNRPRAGPELVGCDMPLDSNTVQSNADDRLSILEIDQMELDLERDPQIPSRCALDPRRIRRALQCHYDILAR